MTVPTRLKLKKLSSHKICVCEKCQKLAFFQERNATKQDWLAWFHKSKDNAMDHRSYAEVVCTKNISPSILPSTDTCVPRPFNGKLNQRKMVRLERHKQQSPVKNQNSILSKNCVVNIAKPLQNSNTLFQLNLTNRFAPLQDMGSQSLQSNATTTPQPSLRHSTSLSNSRVSPKKWCNKNHLPHNHENNLSPACSPFHQTVHQDSLECKQGKIPQ